MHMAGRRNMKNRGKKTVAALLLSASAIAALGTGYAYADFGSGVAVLANKAEIIKTALVGKKIVFSDLDFKQGLCITDFESIKITSIPLSSEGTLMLAGRRVKPGMTIKRKNLGALVFIPSGSDIEECRFKFTVDEFASGAEVDFVIKFTDKVNYAPTVAEGSTNDGILWTQREIAVYGQMSATDKENDLLEYVIIKYPEVGSIKILDKNSGQYLYTPPDDFVGEDKFTYVARDEYGNFSKPREVSISVAERMSEVVYTDMKLHPEYNAAVALTAMEIMDGRLIGDGVYFQPESDVTIAEFVAMALKCAGVKPEKGITETFFDDDDEIPDALKGYIATAQKKGIVTGRYVDGELLLCPNERITRYEAAVIMASLTDADLSGDVSAFSDANSIPIWAKGAVSAMCSLGIFDTSGEKINADATLTKAECAAYLYRLTHHV